MNIKFVARKILASFLTLLAITFVNFAIFRMVPGDPIRMMFKDPRVSIEDIEAMKVKYGLDKPMMGQYINYMKNLAKGELGISFWQKKPVGKVIAERIPRTLGLIGLSLFLAVVIGTILGAVAGWKGGSKTDSAIMGISMTLYSVPSFAFGILLMLAFAYHFAIFPLGGIETPASGFTGIRKIFDIARHMVLPSFSIVLWYIGQYILITRSSMKDVLSQPYIVTARAKGVRERRILTRHALRNAFLPLITITGVNIAFMTGGIIEAETVFSWPGLGRLFYDAVMKRDYPLLQGCFLVFAVAVVILNFAVDLLYTRIDPRVRINGEAVNEG
ncbi:MAG: ABC transporter permease [Spirochaetales bacterium]|uniref:ABC transporter permease n=1 Tax=Candidatus Thalassospirochaeta sargassi TaxID=3119039 RepID=A0AAJ1IDA4_9SPIO|nr:ABC transporter permease [Spirochaetales bacterium]